VSAASAAPAAMRAIDANDGVRIEYGVEALEVACARRPQKRLHHFALTSPADVRCSRAALPRPATVPRWDRCRRTAWRTDLPRQLRGARAHPDEARVSGECSRGVVAAPRLRVLSQSFFGRDKARTAA
jgi:hypothetical protein